jgi:hypothetical protein
VHSSSLTATASKPKAAVASTTVEVWHKSQATAIEPAARRTRCMGLVYMGSSGIPNSRGEELSQDGSADGATGHAHWI